jgi:hypothetical protein
MSYTKRPDLPVVDGELAVELETGDLIAVRCNRKRVDAGVCYHARARAIDEAGATRIDAAGRDLVTEFKHSVPVGTVDELGDGPITRECLLAVLGEPLTKRADGSGLALFPWADSMLTGVSIRVSIAAGQVSGTADAGAAL